MDRSAQEQRERERVQQEERAARMSSLSTSGGTGSKKDGDNNGEDTVGRR